MRPMPMIPKGAAMHFGSGKHVVTPALPQARAQKVFALGHAPRCGQQRQGKSQSRRWFPVSTSGALVPGPAALMADKSKLL